MKKSLLLVLIASLGLFSFGCASHGPGSTVKTKQGAVLGAAVGAAAGAAIGEHKDRELEGAAVGAGIGLIAGGILGSAEDEKIYAPR